MNFKLSFVGKVAKFAPFSIAGLIIITTSEFKQSEKNPQPSNAYFMIFSSENVY